MNSPIKTLENTLHGLKLEIETWSDPRNYSKEIIDTCKKEIKEHEQALEIIRKENDKTR